MDTLTVSGLAGAGRRRQWVLSGLFSVALLASCVQVDPGEGGGNDPEDAVTGSDITGADTARPRTDTAGSDTASSDDGSGPDGASEDTDDNGGSVCSDPWSDSDGDGHPCRYDNCPKTKNVDQKDRDGDGVGDKCDNCPDIGNADQKDTDPSDGTGDACTLSSDPTADRDGDGTANAEDNCPSTANPMQTDSDDDGIGDKCDNCRAVANTNQKDSNNDMTGDACTDDTPDVERGQAGDSDGDGLSDQDERDLGTASNNHDSDGDGVLDGAEVIAGSDPTSSDNACGQKKHTANLEEKPIDIIVVIDTSGSMNEEIDGVEKNINKNFGNKLSNSGLDYRVIMIAERGDSTYQVCVDPPLASANCGNTSQFKHLDEEVNSHDSLEKIISNYGSYKQWLRKDAFKIFLEITDDDCDYTSKSGQHYRSSSTGQDAKDLASAFDKDLTGLSTPHFGTPNDRNYVWHSIVGLEAKSNPSTPYKSNESVVNRGDTCHSGVDGAEAYQWLSKWTDGLRYPVCHIQSYDAVFKEIAKGIVQRSRIQCKLSVPSVSSGKFADLDSVALQWKPNKGSKPELMTQVDSKSKCSQGHFYVKNDTIHLCPQDCNTINSATEGNLTVLTGCQPCENPSKEVCDGKDNDCDGKTDEGCEDLCQPEREVCDGNDNDCDDQVDEGCPDCTFDGGSCSADGDCCNGHCRDDGTCGPPCRPSMTACTKDGQCCSGTCAAQGGGIGKCTGG